MPAPVDFEPAEPEAPVLVSGRVFAAQTGRVERGLSDVCVSDGTRIVRTDGDGYYTLPMHAEELESALVYITVPTGYSAPLGANGVPSFYRHLTPGAQAASLPVDFSLRCDPRSDGSNFTFAHITDTHVASEPGAQAPDDGDGSTPSKLARQLHDIAALPTLPAFVLASGDLTYNGSAQDWRAYLQGVANSRLPIWPVVGNHDHDEGRADPTGTYRRHLGPSWYSFDYGEVHFIQLENNGCLTNPVQLQWLKKDLELNGRSADGATRPIVISTHQPLDTPHPGGTADQIDALFDLLSGYDVKAFFNGHSHTNVVDRHLPGGAVQYNTASANYNDDHSPTGFREVAISGGQLTTSFRMFARDYTIAAVCPGPRSQVGRGRTEFQVNAYNTSSHVMRVEVRVDGREPQLLRPTGKFSWSTPWDTRTLALGGHTAEITAVDDAGKNWSTKSTFTVVPEAATVRPGADITEFHGGTDHTGIQPGHLGIGGLNSAWWFRSGSTIGMSSPVVADGMVYIGTWDTDGAQGNGVHALDLATGARKWHFATDSLVQSTPVVHDRTLYVTQMRGVLTAIDAATGKQKWSYTLPGTSVSGRYDGYVYGGPTVFGSTVYYFGYTTTGSHLVALHAATGKELWNSPVDRGWWASSAPTVYGGKVYVHGSRGGLHIYKATTGGQLAVANGHGGVAHSTPVIADGRVFTTDFQGNDARNLLLARDAMTGKELWRYQSTGVSKDGAGQPGASAAVDGSVVYAGFTDGQVAAFDTATGRKLWSFQTGRAIVSSPTISGNTLWIGGTDGHLYGLDKATGAKLHKTDLGAPILSTPTVTGNTLLIGAWDGNLYAFTGRS
ncbi:PQQ-binding-like beta-propeller repeat protein [Streptomyces sp. bgisy031]|uniref:outer membrane protein assembly factor BamB family protein n=1 Tax=Streptomyces sp. bgisy031 TaxID=3413772 RepID=UPI003D72BD2A